MDNNGKESERDIVSDILEVGIALTSEKDKGKIFDIIVEKCMSITHCHACVLYLHEKDSLVLEYVVTYKGELKTPGSESAGADKDSNFQLNIGEEDNVKNIVVYTAISGDSVNIDDIYSVDRFDFSLEKQYDRANGYRTRSMLVIPLKDNSDEVIGVLQMVNAYGNEGQIISFSKMSERIIASMANQAAIAVANMRYIEEIKTLMRSFVQAMSTAIDERTPYNGSHTRKVTMYAGMMADYINRLHIVGGTDMFFSEQRRDNLLLAAGLHDIGKMIVPLSVMNKATRLGARYEEVMLRYELIQSFLRIDMLEGRISEDTYNEEYRFLERARELIEYVNPKGYIADDITDEIDSITAKAYKKPDGSVIRYMYPEEADCMKIRRGTLSASERKIMESHVEMTEKILSRVHFDKTHEKIPVWASTHHEMLDGSGYPKKLKGDEIEPEARILAIIDIYDALTSADRPYKTPMPKTEAFIVLKEMALDGKLDKLFVEYFENVVNEYEIVEG
ncbi:MAG: GAF domain-containing protein [Lachnospiraceae bacterium]|nr:GAF domain-containing protein [Lachnospiraceae bacterium]